MVEYLLARGAAVNATDDRRRSPLFVAVHEGRDDMVRLLTEHGADVNLADERDWTPLHAASWNGDKTLVQFLLTHGANVSATNTDGHTPLQLTIEEGHRGEASPLHRADVATLLRQHGS